VCAAHQAWGRGLHSSTFQLNLSRLLSPIHQRTHRIPQNVLTLSREVDECKPLAWGARFQHLAAAPLPRRRLHSSDLGAGDRAEVGRCRLTL
jgi:hypothetical protein